MPQERMKSGASPTPLGGVERPYRDDVRRFWRGDDGMLGLFASRICGSADIYTQSGKGPEASINFVTCHDGFTLNDLVSYRNKHNEANGENNHDGTNSNLSENCGTEGETTVPAVGYWVFLPEGPKGRVSREGIFCGFSLRGLSDSNGRLESASFG